MTNESLLAWQWRHYPIGHRSRTNLLIHVISAPMFVAAALSIPASLVRGAWLGAVIALVTMVLVVAAQGRGHRTEVAPPLPFRGPFDVIARLVVEQFVTFPRYVLSGHFARAWREAGVPAGARG